MARSSRPDVSDPGCVASLRQRRGRRWRERRAIFPGGSAGSIRLLLVGGLPSVRRGLEMRLALEDDLEVVGEASDATEAISLARALRPDVILVDVDTPAGRSNMALAGELCSAAPWSAVVVLTLSDAAATQEQARAAGAASFVAKHGTEETLVPAIRRAVMTHGEQSRNDHASASKEESHGDAMRDHRSA